MVTRLALGSAVIGTLTLLLAPAQAGRGTLTSAAAESASYVGGAQLPAPLVRTDTPRRGRDSVVYRFSGTLVEGSRSTFSTATVCHVTRHARRDVLLVIKDAWTMPRMSEAGARTDNSSFVIDYRPHSRAAWRRFLAFGHGFSGQFDPFLVMRTSLESTFRGALPKAFDLRVVTKARVESTVAGFENTISVAC